MPEPELGGGTTQAEPELGTGIGQLFSLGLSPPYFQVRVRIVFCRLLFSVYITCKPFLCACQHYFFSIFFFTSPRAVSYGGWFSYMDKIKAFQQENPDQPLLNISYEEMSLVRIC